MAFMDIAFYSDPITLKVPIGVETNELPISGYMEERLDTDCYSNTIYPYCPELSIYIFLSPCRLNVRNASLALPYLFNIDSNLPIKNSSGVPSLQS